MLLPGLTVAGGGAPQDCLLKTDGPLGRLANSEKMSPWIEKIKIIRGRVFFPKFKMG